VLFLPEKKTMLMSALVLAAALSPQDAPATPAPEVASVDLPAGDSAAEKAAIDKGLAAFKRRRFAAAEADFKRAMEAAPASPAPYFYLAYTYYKQAEPKRPFHPDKEKAREMFAKAYSIDPAFRPVWGERAAKP
jgi:Tfp pilus assembly protein PilF